MFDLRNQLFDLVLKQFRRLIEHQPRQQLADHVGVLRKGRLVSQMTRDELRRTVLRYRVEVPETWQPPPEVRIASIRRSRAVRSISRTRSLWIALANASE